jgi:hypothetical protein
VSAKIYLLYPHIFKDNRLYLLIIKVKPDKATLLNPENLTIHCIYARQVYPSFSRRNLLGIHFAQAEGPKANSGHRDPFARVFEFFFLILF